MKNKIRKVVTFVRTYFGHTILTLGIILCYLPIIYSNDIDLVKGFSGIALLLFLIYTLLPINTYQIVLIKFRDFIKKEVKNNDSIKYIEDKLNVITGEYL